MTSKTSWNHPTEILTRSSWSRQFQHTPSQSRGRQPPCKGPGETSPEEKTVIPSTPDGVYGALGHEGRIGSRNAPNRASKQPPNFGVLNLIPSIKFNTKPPEARRGGPQPQARWRGLSCGKWPGLTKTLCPAPARANCVRHDRLRPPRASGE